MPSGLLDFLDDPRAPHLSDAAFRVGVLHLLGRPFGGGPALTAARVELRRMGLDVPTVTPFNPIEPDEPLSTVRTRQGKCLPVAWLQRFEKFWDVYDYKKDRLGAVTAWYRLEISNLTSPVDFDAIGVAAERYKVEMSYRPGASRKQAEGWLNDRRFEDVIDGGEYSDEAVQLIQLFNELLPHAEEVSIYSPARAELIRGYLVRSDLKKAANYFMFLGANPELLSFVQGPWPLTTILSPEVERKARELRAAQLKQS